ncbi:MAG: hypothetical protein A2864_02270 [Candidatus Woykebacteria bacterium RIFCSPHIGHO2_01_FULL_39_12]|uniref:Uncharacterized protein n=1 Tax=Candidatus Woykebacteria bacterium RIFCSPHIGHO2_01_FULL_39_12 TaxID=1802599 RepID=A0A1G1WJ90_9BACT|nr:MAG: hypothetical protein A2864_02270 [Candidatus Woykebacteria bacterium RIFCSPHIGHO2_01_FULL_39_12]
MAFVNTIFGDPKIGERLVKLLDTTEPHDQFAIFIDEFTKEERRHVVKALSEKPDGEYNELEWRLLEVVLECLDLEIIAWLVAEGMREKRSGEDQTE